MSVIARSRLLGQRLRMLERRRADLVKEHQEAVLAGGLPTWAADVLRRVGMTGEELEAFATECARQTTARPAADIEAAMAALDRSIDEAERELLACDADGPHWLEMLADVAVQRLRRTVPSLDGDGAEREVRALLLMERLLRELRQRQEGSLSEAV